MFRDSNSIFEKDFSVGNVENIYIINNDCFISGKVDSLLINQLGLAHIIVVDIASRFVAGCELPHHGQWEIKINQQQTGNDNSALDLKVYAVPIKNNYGYIVDCSFEPKAHYCKFIKSKLPLDSRIVPSLKDDLRALVQTAMLKDYIARSIHDSISTGNNYQSVDLDKGRHKGGRISRVNYLELIDFKNKSVLDLGANTGENSRIARRLGASLVDGYEYDPYFVEIGRAINALTGMTRVSLFQGDITQPELFYGMKCDIALCLNVWVYLIETIKYVSEISDMVVFETHTLDHGMTYYVQSLSQWFPYIVSVGLSDKPSTIQKSRMFLLMAKDMWQIDRVYKRRYIRIKPYYHNKFIEKHNLLSKTEIYSLARELYQKHSNRNEYSSDEYKFGSECYFEIFIAGFHQFIECGGRKTGTIFEDNVFYSFLNKGINLGIIDSDLKVVAEEPSRLIRKISNKYEDLLLLADNKVDMVAPFELRPDKNGTLLFHDIDGTELCCNVIDGHHRYFCCELLGYDRFHYRIIE